MIRMTSYTNSKRGQLQCCISEEKHRLTAVSENGNKIVWRVTWAVIMCSVLFFNGCSGALSSRKHSAAPKKYTTWKLNNKRQPVYYSFKDVLIPGELKINKQKTSLYKSGGFMAGVMTLYGMMPARTLQSFFERNMITDNWRKMSSYVSFRTILLYQKQNRSCIIYIYEKDFKKIVEIWVVPLTPLAGTHAGR